MLTPYPYSSECLSGRENNFAIDCKTWRIFIALDFSAFIKPTNSLYSASVSFSRTCKSCSFRDLNFQQKSQILRELSYYNKNNKSFGPSHQGLPKMKFVHINNFQLHIRKLFLNLMKLLVSIINFSN